MMQLEFAQASDCGKVREHNEDYLGFAEPGVPDQARSRGWLFALADGVGGQDHGEVASRLAIETLVAGFQRAAPGEAHTSLLPRLVQQANTKIFEAAIGNGAGGSSMATTVVSCALRYDRAVVAHVGDSRCYRIRHGHAEALTRDHTVAAEHVVLGLLSSGEAAQAETRHLLSRSLGSAMFVGVDTREHQVVPGDILLLCSDGLHGALDADDIARITMSRASLAEAAERLIAVANERDGGDNVSVQLIRIHAVERVGMYRGRPYKLA